jgi:TRAP-type C4-dicarboxylate transport system permease large subunit
MVYSLVAGVDFNIAFKAVLLPGLMVIALLGAYSMYVGAKEKIPRRVVSAREMAASLWDLKWELGIPVILVLGLKTGLAAIDECAGLVALYTVLIEVFVYKDLKLKKDIPNIAKSSMALGGAVILILSMANALINYVIQEKIPDVVLEFMLKLGLSSTWQFLIVMNMFLLVLGMLMEGFSAILVAVPLILPFAARFHLGPFHLAMIFLLNLELAYVCPPLGLNLFISSFRFNRPVVSLYKVVIPFTGVLLVGLLLVSYVPGISDGLIQSDIRAARAQAEKELRPPREAWLMECVQADRSNPLPCTEEEKQKYTNGQMPVPATTASTASTGTAPPQADAGGIAPLDEDALLAEMMGGGSSKDGGAKANDAGTSAPTPAPTSTTTESDDDLFKKMMGAGKDDGG